MKKTLALILAVLMLVSCTALAEEDLFAEPWTLSFVSWNCGEIVDDNVAELWLEEKFNVEITATRVDLSNTEQKNLMLASGEMPEAGWQVGGSTLYTDQGLTRLIPVEMVRKYAPNYAAALDADPIGWQYNYEADEDALSALTGITTGDSKGLMCVRLDWMETLGLKIPEYEEIPALNGTAYEGKIFKTEYQFTADELYEVMYAFTWNDPDGNGQNDTTGVVGNSTLTNFGGGFMWNMFGLHWGRSADFNNGYDENGEFYMTYTSKEYKEALRYWAKAYADKLIDQEYVAINTNQGMWEKFANGRAGIGGTMAAWGSAMTERPPYGPITMGDEKAKVLVMPHPTDNEGNYAANRYSVTAYNYNFVVREDVDDEKLAKILAMFDFMNFDPEAQIFLRCGQDGVHHDVLATGGYAFKEGVGSGKEWGFGVYNANYIQTEYSYKYVNNAYQSSMNLWAADFYADATINPAHCNLFTNDATENFKEVGDLYNAAVNTVVSEYMTAVITGEKDLDATWDEYIEELKLNGYDEICAARAQLPTFEQFMAGEF